MEPSREETTPTRHPSSPSTGRCRAADATVFLLFLAVPLAAAPGFWDQFTSVKWYVLEALAATWFLVELWGCGSRGWPAFVRRHWAVASGLGLLVVASCLRRGVAWGGAALLDRLSFVLLALASFWYFRRNQGRTKTIEAATWATTALVAVVGLAQALGWDPLPYLRAGDHRSAFFGNVNMTAQFLGFAVVILTARDHRTAAARVRTFLRELLLVLSFVYLCLLGCRSVFVALGVALVVRLLTGRVSLRRLAVTLATAALLVLLLLGHGSALGPRSASTSNPGLRPVADKVASTAMRLAVWRGTLELIRDHPLGVGSASFAEAFIPYQLGLEEISTETLLFRSPHNEYLRTLAEDGAIVAVLAACALLCLLRALWAQPQRARGASDSRSLLASGAAFFAVEAFFQFPFGTAFGALMAAVLLGLALASLETPSSIPESGRTGRRPRLCWPASGTLAAAVVVVLLGRTAASEWLFVNRSRRAQAQDAACRLDPRNLPACVTAAWLDAAAGRRAEARARLVRVLRRVPYYHPAIRLLAEVAAVDGDRRAACRYLWIYDQLFRGRSSVRPHLESICGAAPPSSLPPGIDWPYYGAMPLAEGDAVTR